MKKAISYGVVVQARASSNRLPGKVLMDIEGQPMLLRQLDRLKKGLGDLPLIVATSFKSSDDAVEELCHANDIDCFRGPLDDVMLRFIECAQEYKLDYIVRVGGDDPLIDPNCCSSLISMHQNKSYDFMYASNREGWPYGSAAELISVDALKKIYPQVHSAFYKEHIIPYFFDHPDKFHIIKVKASASINRPNYYFTVDFLEDLEVVRRIFRLLKDEGDYFPLESVIRLIDKNPEICDLNRHLHNGFDL
jgi:spore coat polysaccharide biosynthesis protein SpsF